MYKIRLLSPWGLYRLIAALWKYGINIASLLSFAQSFYGDKIALSDDFETISYGKLWAQSEKLAVILQQRYSLRRGQKVGFLCKNHGSLVKSIFAVSLLGADICLLNAEMSISQLKGLIEVHDFDLIIYDPELSSLIKQSFYAKEKLLSYHDNLPAVSNLLSLAIDEKVKLQRSSSSKLVLLTGGTTGKFKTAAHRPSVFNFLNPLLTLLTKLKLLNYSTAYIATPIYHGYGIAVLLLFITLGKKMVISRGFNAQRACGIIREHNVEVVTVVPLMVHKMLKTSPEDLKSLACIASGGAELSPKLVEETISRLGDVLYNLYGTSEAGLNIVATPQDLKYSAKTVGRKINGVSLKILDEEKNEVEAGRIGQLCIKNNWSMKNTKNPWIETGDLGYRDNKGYYFLMGRVDDMIVSGGENVYPIEVEQVLLSHPQVEDAAVIGVNDDTFGQRLKAFVLLSKDGGPTKEELLEWLRPKIARFQMPREIVLVDNMPYTPVGKLDKKKLRSNS